MLRTLVYLQELRYRLMHDRRGVTALEYGLIASLIAVSIIGAVSSLGSSLSTRFTEIAAKITTPGS